jgi:phage terminase large subunit-like protein
LLTVRALEQFYNAVIDGDLTHSGEDALTRHVLNAHRRPSRSGLQIAKEHPDSARKIDAAVAAVLAYEARLAAMAKGITGKRARAAGF